MSKRPHVPARGDRNNNPGNIRKGAPWQGLMPRSEMNAAQRAENEFCVFRMPRWGIRAIARVLVAYYDKYGLSTVRSIIGRWAPPSENDTNSYSAAVASELGVAPNEKINLHDYEVMNILIRAIIKHELGYQPYSNDIIEAGLRLAGFEKEQTPLEKTVSGTELPALTGAGTLVIGTTVQQVSNLVEAAQPTVSFFQQLSSWAPIAAGVCALGVVVFVLWKKYRRASREGV